MSEITFGDSTTGMGVLIRIRGVFGSSPTAEPDPAAKAESMRARLANPDFEAAEQFFGVRVSRSLRDFYAHPGIFCEHVSKVAPSGAPVDLLYFCWFDPLDSQALGERWPAHPALHQIGDDGSGSKYVVDPSVENPEVLYLEHETGDLRPTNVHLDSLMDLPDQEPG